MSLRTWIGCTSCYPPVSVDIKSGGEGITFENLSSAEGEAWLQQIRSLLPCVSLYTRKGKKKELVNGRL